MQKLLTNSANSYVLCRKFPKYSIHYTDKYYTFCTGKSVYLVLIIHWHFFKYNTHSGPSSAIAT